MTVATAKELAKGLLPDAKLWLRRSGSSLDAEVEQTTAACLLDLRRVGIVNIDAQDPLIQQAAKLYLKAHFGYGDDPERWEQAYARLRDALSLSGDYCTAKEAADG